MDIVVGQRITDRRNNLFKELMKRHHWLAVREGGPQRVKAAKWFLKKMQQANSEEEVGSYWGTGSDVIYYQAYNVTDRESKVALNAIAAQMIRECHRVGIVPGVSATPFKVV